MNGVENKMLNTKNSIIPNLYYIKIKHDANKYLELKIPRTWLIFQAMIEIDPLILRMKGEGSVPLTSLY
jgi:hypothetical protein